MVDRWRIKKGDEVVILAGKDKGKSGTIIKVLRDDRRVVVQGINMIKRHQKAAMGNEGGIISKEASLHASNVAIMDPTAKRASRIGIKILEDGKKVRIAKRSGDVIDA